MRIEVFCENRIGLASELLDLLASHQINLCGVDALPSGLIYLSFPKIEFEAFSTLLGEIRLISGVKDVRKVSYMPSERNEKILRSVIETIPEPIISFDDKGLVQLANSAALDLFSISATHCVNKNIASLLGTQQISRDFITKIALKDHSQSYQNITIRNQCYQVILTPFFIEETANQPLQAGSVAIFRQMTSKSYYPNNREPVSDDPFLSFTAESARMIRLIEQAKRCARLDVPLLITGDTGTGKDKLAAACHAFSHRREMPFLALNCAALPDDVVESELFGHAPGAYPNAIEGKKGFFEQASGGSVLLDEIGEMSPRMQTKLLRFLNDGTFRRVGEDQEVYVDVRVICATQRNLLELVEKDEFREDLYYRLNVLMLQVPPLKARNQDIIPLVKQFVSQYANEQNIIAPKLASDLMPLLTEYAWPGNVRQLRNVVYRALVNSDSLILSAKDIVLPSVENIQAFNTSMIEGSLDDISKRFERFVLEHLYDHYPSTRKLAKRLDVSHTAIANKLREYGINHTKKSQLNKKDDSNV